MALPFLVGISLLTRHHSMYPQLTLDSLMLNGNKVNTHIKYETSEKYYFQKILHDEIVLKCTAAYAIKWIFGESPIFNSYIQNINITTEKLTKVDNNNLNISNLTFVSFLHIKFYGTSEHSRYNGSIGCQNTISPHNVTWLEVGGSLNTADRFKEISTFRIFRHPKINWYPKTLGENKNCLTSIIIDKHNGQLGCRWKNESVKRVALRNVLNVNEMEALVTLNPKCKKPKEMYQKCNEDCIQIDTIHSAGIFYCGYGQNSLSRPIFKINSTFYFDLYEARQHSDLRIIVPTTKSFYRNKPYEFICKGTYSLYIKGFFWVVTANETDNDPKFYLTENGIDSFGENNQVISKKIITFPDVRLYTVYCCAPDWSSNDSWTESFTVVNISYPNSEHESIMTSSEPKPDFESHEESTTLHAEQKPEVDFLNTTSGIAIIATTVSLFIIVMLSCTILLLIAFRKIRKQSRQLQLITEEEIVEFEKGNPKAETALFLPYNMEFEIPKEQLYIGSTILGEGNYGIVQKGRYGSLQVAVKTVKKSNNGLYFKSLLSELKIMTYVGRHINIVHLVGACTKDLRKGYVCLVYEFCANGNMQQFLRDSRKTFGQGGNASKAKTLSPQKDQKKSRATSWVETTTTCAENLTLKDLVLWSQQIASGMEYLSSKNIIHGDLAARNVLITDKMHAKLADFGLSKQLFDYSIYIQKQHCPLPLKWMAPESLRDMEFSVQSDVWSYGVTLWEIYSLGELPYPGVDWNYESWKMLCNGFRMERPRYASPVLFKIILECWRAEPNERPTFKFLKDYFGEELQQLILMPRRVFDKLWVQ